jgi:diguanylate cyclase (GGDEF)-like protein
MAERGLRARRAVALCACVYAGAFFYVYLLCRNNHTLYNALTNVHETVAALLAGGFALAYARRGEHESGSRCWGWRLLGLGCLSWCAGQVVWTYYESVRHVEVPCPSWADAGYLGFCPLLIGGVVLLFGSMPIAGRARLLLDSAITAAGLGLLSWYFLVREVWHQSDASLLGKIISVAYPLCDVAALFGALVLLWSASDDPRLRRVLGLFAGGVLLVTLADSFYTLSTLNEGYQSGSWYDVGWDLGLPLIAYALWLPLRWRSSVTGHESRVGQAVSLPVEDARQANSLPHPRHGSRDSSVSPSLVRAVAPYAAVLLAAMLIATRDYTRDGRVSDPALAAVALLVLLVIIRQVCTLLENQQLATQLRGFNENLERIVARRTQQLTALQQLTRAVNDTRHVEHVLAAAAEHTQQALQADAVLLWLLQEETVESAEQLTLAVNEGLEQRPEAHRFVRDLPATEALEMLTLPARPYAAPAEIGTLLRAPLHWQQQRVGVIGVVRWGAGFERGEAELLESIGLETATALENARLYGAALEAADHDSVTGLHNHRALHQRLRQELERAREQTYPLTVLMMDVNNFKLFNDTYGHPVGDQVLQRVAQVLHAECEPRDVLGRFGGDEFLAILPGSDCERAVAVAQRLREHLMREGFRRAGEERTIPVSLSFGIATFPRDSQNRHDLLTIADANLYTAKGTDDGIRGTTETQRTHSALRTEGSFGVLDAMVTAVDNKDRYTRRHSEDVTEYALWIAEELRLSQETMRVIRIGGLLHDVGKIGVPDEILRKPGRLTAEEWEVMKRHPQLGALIVGGVPDLVGIIDAVRYHHERWDGHGYPEGRAGDAIPLLGRILAVADAFSAMTTDRPYRKGLAWDVALAEIRANIGTQFDPTMARAFLTAAEQHLPSRASLTLPVPAADTGHVESHSNGREERLLMSGPPADAGTWAPGAPDALLPASGSRTAEVARR